MYKIFLIIAFSLVFSGCSDDRTEKEKQADKEYRTQEVKTIGKIFKGGSELFKDE